MLQVLLQEIDKHSFGFITLSRIVRVFKILRSSISFSKSRKGEKFVLSKGMYIVRSLKTVRKELLSAYIEVSFLI